MRIAIDLNGGDKSPEEILKGSLEFSAVNPKIKLIFCVTKESLYPQMLSEIKSKKISIEYFTHSVGMKETPIQSKKDKPDNTISGALKLLKENRADCALSCGNSGAVILNAIDILGLKDQKINPSLMSLIPLYNRNPLALFDVGALGNHNFNAELYFSILPEVVEIYRKLFFKPNPKIKLLNIGSEAWKGTNEHKKLFQLLKDSSYNFDGNIEGDELIFTDADIVITDGLTGNIVLKLLESFNELINEFKDLKDCNIKDNYLNFLLEDFCYETIGGAPLLGINGKVVIGHGKSSSKAVKSALELCVKYAVIYKLSKVI
ncbi:MAG: hypothetical protein KKD38_04470 [Candidatus Delongbacteria bacterium]|nr:hypothetical protein [Candidatus Delongbacteria bacterium]MCG2760912.1 hypothetical protein [Candidatus Delongbacteria bacterium]